MKEFYPDLVLFDSWPVPCSLPPVDQYVGIDWFMYKALQLQQSRDARGGAAHAARAFNDFGLRRMWSIHPEQIEPILNALRPEQALIELAAQILIQAQAQEWVPNRHHDQLHDRASCHYFWSVLKAVRAFAAESSTYTAPLFTAVRNMGDSHVGGY